MLGLILAVPLACAPAASRAADDPLHPTREFGGFFATLAIDQPLEEALPLLGVRLTAVFHRRFGLEGGLAMAGPFVTLQEVSALAAIQLAGRPVLLKAGVSHIPAHQVSELSFRGASTGFHAGASLLTGDVDDRVRWRFDYTYRQLGLQDRGVSSVGLALVLDLKSDRAR